MRKHPTLWLSLCLSSVMVTVSLIATPTIASYATRDGAIAQLNACAGKSDPCAGKTNPCAGKKGNVGGPLSKQLQGKPVVVDIYATWCSACKNIAPTLSQLKQEYAGKAHFIVLDVSDKGKAKQAEKRAKELGLGSFFAANKAQTGTIAIIDPATGDILAQYRNNTNKSAYTSVLTAALSRK